MQLKIIAKAASEYKEDMTEKEGNIASLDECAQTWHSSVGVYVRLNDNQLKRKLQIDDKSISYMEK